MLAACDTTARIPMAESGVRSLNLSASAAIGLFEALRQIQS
jgi:tRNA (cytidine/uridine-2'-O-)-methyltransferase